MNYFIIRNGQQYGPYTLADLQRYVASGQILLTDLARSEGMSEPVPVSQIVGTVPAPQAQISASPVINSAVYSDPPNLHWGLVLLFSLLSCGLFSAGWNLVQAAWMKKVAPDSRALYYYVAGLCVLAAILFELPGNLRPLPTFLWGSDESGLWHSHPSRKIQPEEFA